MLNGIDISHHNADQIRRGTLNISAPEFAINNNTLVMQSLVDELRKD